MNKSGIEKVYIRSGFIGDLLVCLPYIIFDITQQKIPIENVGFIILQTNKISKSKIQLVVYNSIKSIFGDNHPFSEKTIIIQNYSIYGLLKAKKKFSTIFKKPVYEYLPFSKESKFNISIKKHLFKILGLKLIIKNIQTKVENEFNKNEYKHLFLNENDFKIGVSLLQSTPQFLGECKSIIVNDEKYILVYPNSQLELKKWPIENYIEVISYFVGFLKLKVYLIGGMFDYDYNNLVIESLHMKDTTRVINLAGKLSIRDNIELAKNASLFIGNDGGPMHMAAIFGTPIISIFSYKDELGIWDPVLSRSYILLRGNVDCKICNFSYCENNMCITKVKPSHVIDAFNCINNDDKKYSSNWII